VGRVVSAAGDEEACVSSPRLAIAIAALGHFLLHFVLGIYLVVVLVIQRDWGQDYNFLISLWTAGAFLVGLGGPLAGWLSDRWGEITLMIVFFLGLGAAALLTGLAGGPPTLTVALALLGLFGSIYHPVGTSLAIRNATGQGKVIGLVGLFGSLGFALSAPIAGALAGVSWRLAFLLPGGLSIVLGLAVWMLKHEGLVLERRTDLQRRAAAPSAQAMMRAFYPLSLAMLLFSVIYAAFTTALPKWLSQTLPGGDNNVLDIGLLVALVYSAGILAQLIGGWIADRWSAKWAYVGSFLGKCFLLALASGATGWQSVGLAAMVMFLFDIGAPAENVLIARFSPDGKRGLIYGIRQGVGLIAAPLGVQCVAYFYRTRHGFSTMLLVLAALALLVAVVGLLVPRDRPASSAQRRPISARSKGEVW
jgi:FSR family fosmidomycin resistance protein-like MFS transporter